ncbi:hypothetical protein FJT64_007532 [Amphibalanus amphitrite]|uniref:Uncharacterized protein n=1 Tax=Amphibalanus amphitrite TaxID=1232801 RepID=A0A6A4VZB7_AMPAM|nr:hypothetical protein FJT64_007532 [Amphibalanus amphitrite]
MEALYHEPDCTILSSNNIYSTVFHYFNIQSSSGINGTSCISHYSYIICISYSNSYNTSYITNITTNSYSMFRSFSFPSCCFRTILGSCIST